MASGHFFKQIVNAPGFQENGTNLSAKYLGISATAADSLKLGGVAASGYATLSGATFTGVVESKPTTATDINFKAGYRTGIYEGTNKSTYYLHNAYFASTSWKRLDASNKASMFGAAIDGNFYWYTASDVNSTANSDITWLQMAKLSTAGFDASILKENGTSLSEKYLGISAVAADSSKLGGVAASGYSPLSHNHSATEITTGTLAIARGGTGTTTAPTAWGMIYAASSGAYSSTAAGTAKQVLQSNGAAAPTWTTLDLTYLPDAWVKKSVKIATTANLSAAYASNVLTASASGAIGVIDGITPVLNDRILVKDQTTAAHNGIYYLSNAGSASTKWTMTRVTGGDNSSELAGATVNVDQGAVNAGKLFSTFFKTTDTLGTTAVNWYEIISSAGATMVGKFTTSAPTTGAAGLNLPHGTAPTTPTNGDIWTTTGGLYTRINGFTKTVSFSDHTHTYEPAFTTLGIAKGGTGATTATAAFDALSPTTNVGEIAVRGSSASQAIAANTTTTRKFLRQTGTGSAGAVPVWDTLVAGDIPDISGTYATSSHTHINDANIGGPYSLSDHNHNTTYLGINATAADASKLGGVLPSGYALSGHTHAYEPSFTTLAISKGGTGLSSAASGAILIGPASGANAAPTWRRLVEGDIPSLNASKIGAGTLIVERGGTGLATATQYGVIYGNGTSAFGVTSSGAAAQILLGGATAPTWQAAPTTSKQVLTSTSTSALSWQTLDLTYLPDSWLKKSVLVATTANITLSGTQTIDGVAVVANDRVLVKNQTDAKTNGIYAVSSGAWTRVTGADTPSELAGATVSVDRGAANGGRIFSTNFASNQAIGTDNINWYELTDTRTTFRSDTSNSVDVRFAPGDGRGVRFWDSENYKIWMSAAGHATYGGEVDTTSDYNMYFQMSGAGASATRGFVWKGSYNSGAATTLAHLTTNGFHLNSGDYKVGETTVIDTSRNISGVNGVFSGSITEGGTALSNKYEDRLKKIKGVPSLAYSFNTDFVSKRTLTQVPLPTAAWWGTFYKGYVWVRSWTTNTLFKINPSDFSVTSITIPGATGTGTVACGGGYIWVSNSTGNSIVRVNPDTDAIVDTITVTNTRKMVFDGMHMWALNESTGTITRIHATTLTQTSITLSGTTRLVFDGSHVWAVRSASNLLEKIDISTVTSVGSVTAGANLRGTIFDGRHIWTIDYGNENLIKIDPNTNAVVSTITGLSGSANLSSELGFDGTFIWLPVSSGTAHTIKLIDPISHATVYTISTPIDFSSIVFDGEAMWFGNTSASSFQRVYV